MLEKNDVKAQVEFSLNLRKGIGPPVIDVTVGKDRMGIKNLSDCLRKGQLHCR